MEKVDLRFRLTDGAERVEMTTVVDGSPKIQTSWSADDIDGLIRVLSPLRMDMSTSVPSSRPVPNKLRKVVEPSLAVSMSDEGEAVTLSLRHPGLGWIDWSFSKERLAQTLSGMVSVLKSRGGRVCHSLAGLRSRRSRTVGLGFAQGDASRAEPLRCGTPLHRS